MDLEQSAILRKKNKPGEIILPNIKPSAMLRKTTTM